MVRGEIKICVRRERNKLIKKTSPNLTNVKNRATEFSLNIQNRYSVLNNDENTDIDQINEQFTSIIQEATLDVGGRKEIMRLVSFLTKLSN